MNLDPKTIVLLNFISTLMMSIGLLNISRGYLSQIRDVRNWALATLIQASGWLLIGLRGVIPDVYSILLANTLLLVNIALYFNILAKFKKVEIKSFWIFLPVIVSVFAIIYYTFKIPHFGNRVIIISACSVVLMYASSYLLLFHSRSRNKTHLFTGLVFFICGTIMLIRTLVFINSAPKSADYLFARNITNDILYLSYFTTSVMLTFGFVLMCNDSYLAESKLTEAELIKAKEILEETNQIARIGSWEIDVVNNKTCWSGMTKEILEVPVDYVTDLKSSLHFYKEGESRDTISNIMKSAQYKTISFDVNLQILTAKGNERWVRVMGKNEINDTECTRIFGIFQDITKEIQLKLEVKLVEDRFKNAFKYSAFGITLVGLDERWIMVNQQMCDITGYTNAELLNLTFKDITHPEDLTADLNYLMQLREGSIKSYSMEKRYIHKNGNIIWVFLAVSAIRDENNKVIQFISQVKEINSRKKTENELLQSQQEYKSLFDQNPDAVYSLDKEGNFVSVNDSLVEMVGCSRNELLQMHFSDLAIPEDLEKIQYHFSQAKKGIPQNYSASFINVKGKTYTLSLTNMPIIVDGIITGNYGIAKDITEHVTNSRNLKESEQQLLEAQKIARMGSYKYDFKSREWSCSKIVVEISGIEPEKINNFENWKSLIAPEFKEEFINKMQETIKQGKDIPKNNHDYKIIRPNDGEIRWVTLNGEMEYDNEGNPNILFGTIQDITSRKIAEEKLELSEERYRQIVETAQEGIWMLDKNDNIIFVNKKLCEILDYSDEEIIGKNSIDFMSEAGKTISSKALPGRKHRVKGKYETGLLTKNGKQIWASFSSNPILDDNNNYNGCLAMITDITESAIANETIKKSEEKYRSLFNNNPIPIFIWEPETLQILEVNNAAIREYGYSCEEFYKMSIQDICETEDIKNLNQIEQEIKDRKNTRINKIWKHINKSGELMNMNICTFKIKYNDRPAILAMLENVTEKILRESRLQESFDEIRMLTNHLQSVREDERTHIAREIHDELGQQLTVLKMDIMALKKNSDILSPIAHTKTEHMILMVDKSLQTVKKISSELRPSILDDLGLIAALEWHAKEFQQRTGIICLFETTCLADNFSDKINTTVFRIFQESLTNVARHSKASKVCTKLYSKDGMLLLDIIDNGIGISNGSKNEKISFGLLGMKERATMLNGNISILKLPVGGTNVKLKIPMLC